MKLPSLLAALLLIVSPALAQIVDSDASGAWIASHCAMSSGASGGDYAEYGRKLAKTMALLPPPAQKRILGYVPNPGILPQANASGSRSNVAGANVDSAPTVDPGRVERPAAESTAEAAVGTADVIGQTEKSSEQDGVRSRLMEAIRKILQGLTDYFAPMNESLGNESVIAGTPPS